MDIQLVQISDHGHKEISVAGKEFVIGREPTCHLCLDHGQVSHRHCRLIWRGGRLLVEDLNSANGTFVNNDRVRSDPVELQDGDALNVGPVHFLARLSSGAETLAERTEDWLQTALKTKAQRSVGVSPSDSNLISPLAQTARRILDRITTESEGSIESGGDSSSQEATKKRRGLLVSDSSGIALVKILNRSLIDDAEIGRIAKELQDLIASGQIRITLDFGNVEHCSSQALGTVLKAHRQCRDGGGLLKICTVRPAVAELFEMTNLHKRIEIYPDELPALESLWPHAQVQEEEDEEDEAPAPAKTPQASQPAPSVQRPDAAPTSWPRTVAMPHVRLIVAVGRAKGQAIEINGPRFVIGRDHRCQLRPNSDTISRVHAVIEMRDGHVYLRDYGTKNGTTLNVRTLRGEEAEVVDGDRLQVGVLRFTFRVEPGSTHAPAAVEDELAAWLLGQANTDANASTAFMIPTMPDPASPSPAPASEPASGPGPELTGEPDPFRPEPIPAGQLPYKIINGVLVVTVPLGELDDETTVGPLRHNLHTLLDHPVPRKVVLDLENLHYLSSRAVGVILAYFQRLERAGGTLRVACVSPKILPVLDQMRLPKLIDLYASVEEAVSDPWT
ncbi:hypothetical protein BH23PLA1_BH23PLA1_16900 [soil metagenome]